MLQPNLLNSVFIIPFVNILVAFYKLFLVLKVPGAFGFAIMGLTVTIRLFVHPLFKQQLEMSKKMNELKPQMDKITARFKNDKKRLQEEQLKLYQNVGINPASGCLTFLVQMPIFWALYTTLNFFLQVKVKPNALIAAINGALYFPFLKISTIDPTFFGFNLLLSPEQAKIWYYYLIPLLTGLLQYFQAQSIQPPTVKKAEKQEEKANNTEKKEKSNDDFQSAMNMQMKYMFPFLIGWIALRMPVGLALYWNIFSIFSIMQYRSLKVKSKIINTKSEIKNSK